MPIARDAGCAAGPRAPGPDSPQQRVLAHRHQQAPGKPLPGTAAERQAEMVDDGLQPRRAAGVGCDDVLAEPLGDAFFYGLRFRWAWGAAALVVAAGTALGALAGLFPALNATRSAPVTSLRNPPGGV